MSGFGYTGEIPLVKPKLLATVNGFPLHAATAVNTHSQDRLYKLIDYCLRPPLSDDRLELTKDGMIQLKLKTPWRDGTAAIELSPHEFIHKLTLLVPLPNAHLVTYSGLFSSSHPARKDVILNPEARKGFVPRVNHLEEAEGKKIKLVKDSRWAISRSSTRVN